MDNVFSKVVAILRCFTEKENDEIHRMLVTDGLDPRTAEKLVVLLPMAYCRILLADSGAKFPTTFCRRLPDARISAEQPLHRNHFGKGRSNMPALKLNAELHLTIFSLWPGGALSLMRRIKCFRRVPNWRISSSPHQSCIGRKTGRITIFRSSFSGRLVRRRDACRAGELRGCRGREARCAGGRNDRAGRGPCRRDSPFRWPW